MAKSILVANWKNHPDSLSLAKALLKEMAKKRELYKKLSLFIAPPFTYFESVSDNLGNFGKLASQNISALPSGNYTGQVTPDILKGFGVRLAIIGHSERRGFGETSEHIAKKIKVALRVGIVPLVCIGEKERDTDGENFQFIQQELKLLLGGLSKKEVTRVAVAYEPVWAIGKHAKDAIDPVELSQTVVFMRKIFSDLFGRGAAEKIPILYGGSVEPANAGELMRNSGVRGFLIGHASLSAKSFEAIARSILEK